MSQFLNNSTAADDVLTEATATGATSPGNAASGLYYTGVFILALALGVGIGVLLVNYSPFDRHTLMLVGVMLIGGALGGGVNYFFARADDPSKASAVSSIFVGLVAALLVPLLLRMLSSDLLTNSRTDPFAVLVFLGFCLLAAIASRAFITTLTDRLLQQVREVGEKAEAAVATATQADNKAEQAQTDVAEVKSDVAPIVENATEVDPEDDAEPQEEAAPQAGGMRSRGFTRSVNPLGENERRVLDALHDATVVLRSFSGLQRDSGLDAGELQATLDRLRALGMVGSSTRVGGAARWYIKTAGRKALRG
ncbi:MAG TPA: YEATS-associated helix-containing protein [Pyrinomonadaceae bacterium]|jgi:hypothetical protein|nr:YEATS-associated helix-containing protein [Pyrinomonadaceae bacterium]